MTRRVALLMVLLCSIMLNAGGNKIEKQPKRCFWSVALPFTQMYDYYPDSEGVGQPEIKIVCPAGIGFAYNYVLSSDMALHIPVFGSVENFKAFNGSVGLTVCGILAKNVMVGIGIAVDVVRKQDNGYEYGIFLGRNKRVKPSFLIQLGLPVSYKSWEEMIDETAAEIEKNTTKGNALEAKELMIKFYKYRLMDNVEKKDFDSMDQNLMELRRIQNLENNDPELKEQIEKSLDKSIPDKIENIRRQLLEKK